MKRMTVLLVAGALMAGQATAYAQTGTGSEFTLQGKTVIMLIGYSTGGGTDAAGRMVAPFLTKYLPGKPTIVIQNMPGADGMTAHNHFAQKMKPDGTAVTMSSGTAADPLHYRLPQSKYDPTKFKFVGGVGRGGTVLVISKAAAQRLADKSQLPVVMGSPSGMPRSGMQMTAWGIGFLGWNAKWVSGYRGTKDLFVALERGEIDMTSSANMKDVRRLLNTGRFALVSQSGTIEHGKFVGRTELGNVPVFADLMQGKLRSEIENKAFDYWKSLNATEKWLALPPGAPEPVVRAYRDAFRKALTDPEFVTRGKELSEDFTPQSVEDVESLILTLGNTPNEAIKYISQLLGSQGLFAK